MVVERVGVDKVKERLKMLGKRKKINEEQESKKEVTIEEITRRLDEEERIVREGGGKKRKKIEERDQSGPTINVKNELKKVIEGRQKLEQQTEKKI